MKIIRIIVVLVLLLFMVGSASACESGYYGGGYKGAYSISLDKSADSATYDHEGQVIKYTYTVKNTGRNTITENIQITDNKIPDIITITEDLAPQATVTRTANYIIKPRDMNAGYVTNTATATTYFYINGYKKTI